MLLRPMVVGEKPRSGFALLVVGTALSLAIAGNALLRGSAWGLNLPVWLVLTAVCAFGLVRKGHVTLPRSFSWLTLPILMFGLCFFWRDSNELKLANGFALLIATVVLIERMQVRNPSEQWLGRFPFNLFFAWISVAEACGNLVRADIDWKRGGNAAGALKTVVRGLVIAAPLLAVFALLMAGADAAFNHDLQQIGNLDYGDLVVGFLVVAGLFVLVAGIFRKLLCIAPPARPDLPVGHISLPSTGPGEALVTLATVDTLFVTFVGYQFRFLFGGAARVHSVAGLTYAEYARSGFFELTGVVALALPLLMVGQYFARRCSPAQRPWFIGFGSILTVCVFVVLASAVDRMKLYIHQYALSELRLFTLLLMGWLAVVLVWLSLSFILKKRTFIPGALASAYVFVILANGINPDALIASSNLRLANPDLTYLSQLSLDAAPTLTTGSQQLPASAKQQLLSKAKTHWENEVKQSDWRALNLSRVRYLVKPSK